MISEFRLEDAGKPRVRSSTSASCNSSTPVHTCAPADALARASGPGLVAGPVATAGRAWCRNRASHPRRGLRPHRLPLLAVDRGRSWRMERTASGRHPAFQRGVAGSPGPICGVLDDWTAAAIHDATVVAGQDAGVTRVRKAQSRSGWRSRKRSVWPRPSGESLEVAGRDRTIARLAEALRRVAPAAPGSVIARRVVRCAPLGARWCWRTAGLVVAYLLFNFAQVWWACAAESGPAGAGHRGWCWAPLSTTACRRRICAASALDRTLLLWRAGLALVVVVTGGKEPGDDHTEATAGATTTSQPVVCHRRDVVAEGTGRNKLAVVGGSRQHARGPPCHTASCWCRIPFGTDSASL